jgi:hypothetical protein
VLFYTDSGSLDIYNSMLFGYNNNPYERTSIGIMCIHYVQEDMEEKTQVPLENITEVSPNISAYTPGTPGIYPK